MSKKTSPALTPPSPMPPAGARRRRLPVWAWLLIAIAALVIGVILAPIVAVVSLVVLITGIVALAKGTRTWLRFPSRTFATWVTAAAAVTLLLTGSIANVIFKPSAGDDAVALAAPSPTASASVRATVATTPTPTPSATPTPTPTPTETAVQVLTVIDGDTIDTDAGKVRLIGIDAPEQGSWGYDQATAELTAFLATGPVTLVAVDGRDDVDRYGRLLRYVQVDGNDAGTYMIGTGWAIARYDGRDGYGIHPLQADYVTLDAEREMPAEPAPAPAEPAPAPAPAPVAPAPVAPAPAPAPAPADPATDPQFRTCRDAIAAGYGNYQQGVDPEYNWYQDRDGDGWVCE
jgi:endonuclease YncB( thermonuclease family)